METSRAFVAIVLFLAARPAAAQVAPADRAQFERMLAVFEKAVNENRLDIIMGSIDPSFKGTSIAGTSMIGRAQVQAFMDAARLIMGPGAKYALTLIPSEMLVAGDRARLSGTTREEVLLADGRRLSYKTLWSVDCLKRDGKWYVTGSDAKPNLRDMATIATKVIAARLWSGGLNFKRLRLWSPDFDQDHGSHTPNGPEATPPGREAK